MVQPYTLGVCFAMEARVPNGGCTMVQPYNPWYSPTLVVLS